MHLGWCSLIGIWYRLIFFLYFLANSQENIWVILLGILGLTTGKSILTLPYLSCSCSCSSKCIVRALCLCALKSINAPQWVFRLKYPRPYTALCGRTCGFNRLAHLGILPDTPFTSTGNLGACWPTGWFYRQHTHSVLLQTFVSITVICGGHINLRAGAQSQGCDSVKRIKDQYSGTCAGASLLRLSLQLYSSQLHIPEMLPWELKLARWEHLPYWSQQILKIRALPALPPPPPENPDVKCSPEYGLTTLQAARCQCCPVPAETWVAYAGAHTSNPHTSTKTGPELRTNIKQLHLVCCSFKHIVRSNHLSNSNILLYLFSTDRLLHRVHSSYPLKQMLNLRTTREIPVLLTLDHTPPVWLLDKDAGPYGLLTSALGPGSDYPPPHTP